MRSAEIKSPGLAALAALSTLLALPWCCIAPALLSAAGISAAGLGWLVGPRHLWIFLALSLGALGWSLHLSFVKRQGAPLVRVVSLVIVVATTALWAWRLYA